MVALSVQPARQRQEGEEQVRQRSLYIASTACLPPPPPHAAFWLLYLPACINTDVLTGVALSVQPARQRAEGEEQIRQHWLYVSSAASLAPLLVLILGAPAGPACHNSDVQTGTNAGQLCLCLRAEHTIHVSFRMNDFLASVELRRIPVTGISCASECCAAGATQLACVVLPAEAMQH